mgnify:FL=1|nr:MAG TPA: hypothetical protein [Caudoviricetes sp.]
MTKDFSSLEGIDLEVYAGVDNIIHIDVSDDDGQRIQLEGGTYKAEKKRTPGATSPTMASFDVRWDDIYGALRVFISAAESKKLLTKQSTEDYVYCYDVVWDIDGNKTALCYGKVFVKAGVTNGCIT